MHGEEFEMQMSIGADVNMCRLSIGADVNSVNDKYTSKNRQRNCFPNLTNESFSHHLDALSQRPENPIYISSFLLAVLYDSFLSEN